MAILFTALYRRTGVRKPASLVKPPVQSINNLQLSKSALVNYLGVGLGDVGPRADDYLFKGTNRHVMVQHQMTLINPTGGAIMMPINLDPTVNRYHMDNRQFRRTQNLSDYASDVTMVLAQNYSFLNRKYRYPRTFMSNYNKWRDIQATVAARMDQMADECPTRHQFYTIQMPNVLPSLSSLMKVSLGVNRTLLNQFNTEGKLHVMELWRFITDTKNSVWGQIKYQNLNKINLIIMDQGNWYLMNLGILASMRMMTEKEINTLREQGQEVPDNAVRGYPSLTCAKLMLGGFLHLFSARTQTGIVENWDEQEDSGVEAEDVLDAQNLDPDGNVSETDAQGNVSQTLKIQPIKGTAPRMAQATDTEIDLTKDDDAFWIEDSSELFEEVERELEYLDQAQKEREAAADQAGSNEPEAEDPVELDEQAHGQFEDQVPANTLPQRPQTPEGQFMAVVDKYEEVGMLTPKQVKFFEKTSQNYKSIVAPNGQTLDEFMTVTKEMTALNPKAKAPEVQGVPDQDLVYSVINDFDKKYVKEVLDRDVVSMVVGVQKGGWAVQGFEVEEVRTITDNYKSYAVRIVPVEGLPFTLRFKIPVVDDEGNFMVSGVRYYMRKQQGVHLPIDKVSPTRVALTSYYGKAFIDRAVRPINNYASWLSTQLNAREISSDGQLAFEIEALPTLVNVKGLPRLYTALATHHTSFSIRRTESPIVYSFYVNYEGRENHFGKEVVAKYESEGFILIGETDGGVRLAMRLVGENQIDENLIYAFSDKGHSALGTFEQLLSLDTKKMPVEYSELSIFGKAIPLGVIMAYRMGLDPLLSSLGVEYRRVPVGTHTKLQADEYAIPFADEYIVFKKGNSYANLLIAGFTKYHTSLRNYTSHDFNSQDVYYNVFEEMGVPIRLLGEIDLMFSMFIDPITLEILQDMGEPTDFTGLLLRANELLTVDYSPKQKKRIRGYERFAGIAYQEMVDAMRRHNNTPGRARKQPDISPYQIWNKIVGDESKMQVADINPVENLKQNEALTFSGVGGRSVESMTKPTRKFDPDELGMNSEATVDSYKVGINSYTTSSPKITSLRGMFETIDPATDKLNVALSTSAMLSPGSNTDDYCPIVR